MTYSFEITGAGAFPLTLLSLGFWPASLKDAEKITHLGRRTIELKGVGPPTRGDWLSLGWACHFNDVLERDDSERYHTWPC